MCGLVGIYLPPTERDARLEAGVAIGQLAKQAIRGLQNRGQESAGITVNDGGRIVTLHGMGEVPEALPDRDVAYLPAAQIAIAHTRMSTSKHGGTSAGAQPTFHDTLQGTLSIVHNGTLTNEPELAKESGYVGERRAASDTWFMSGLVRDEMDRGMKPHEALTNVLRRVEGGLSVLATTDDVLYGVRGDNGIRPLVLGRLGGGWILSSELGAITDIGGTFEREVEPGEMVRISGRGVVSSRYAAPQPKPCLFEAAYLARPDQFNGELYTWEQRMEMGRRLAKEAPVEADLVLDVPNSGTLAAKGYAEASGIRYAKGIVKTGKKRSFIAPTQEEREAIAGTNKAVYKDVVFGKRLIIVDDSIVRGTSLVPLVEALHRAGALEVHVRISTPPVKWPCFYGIDFPTRKELIAANMEVDEIRNSLNADSLAYLSLQGLAESAAGSTDPEKTSKFCGACFDGKYPTALPRRLQEATQESVTA